MNLDIKLISGILRDSIVSSTHVHSHMHSMDLSEIKWISNFWVFLPMTAINDFSILSCPCYSWHCERTLLWTHNLLDISTRYFKFYIISRSHGIPVAEHWRRRLFPSLTIIGLLLSLTFDATRFIISKNNYLFNLKQTSIESTKTFTWNLGWQIKQVVATFSFCPCWVNSSRVDTSCYGYDYCVWEHFNVDLRKWKKSEQSPGEPFLPACPLSPLWPTGPARPFKNCTI